MPANPLIIYLFSMRPRKTFNPKRRIRPRANTQDALAILENIAARVSYGGNPEHKRNPGDFMLSPPSQPRQGKSLCDDAGIFSRSEAEALLREGIRRGLISVQKRDGWPQNVWAVTPRGVPLEAMLENPATGGYHGYPMIPGDPLANEVRERWEATDG